MTKNIEQTWIGSIRDAKTDRRLWSTYARTKSQAFRDACSWLRVMGKSMDKVEITTRKVFD